MQRERKREFPNPEDLSALLQKIEAELAVRRTKMDTSRLLGYQIEDLEIRRYICKHVLGYLDVMEKEMVEFWLECIRYDGSYDFSMERPFDYSSMEMRLADARSLHEQQRSADELQKEEQERER
ncbi:hypothetical protein NIA10_14280 [Agathobaculum butyriciproducens]|jgi:hypothetical protein|uniref:hypothetical protein n=1 Tax=Agathobaculum butyriciproducens TaxID=1628085 RepID=UPI002096DD39|nr:hypothetical protein [Agathobaculum butyriciproducens]